MTPSSIFKAFFSLLLLSGNFQSADANRIVAFQYVGGSGTCGGGSEFNLTLGGFHVDCGNANHGCTPGHSIMIYGDFEALDTFYSVADIDIKACEFGTTLCTSSFIMTDMNLCADLELWDEQGYSKCNEVGNYTFEASYTLPNHTWWEDLAIDGLSFQIYLTLGQDLTCHGKFVTHVYYGKEKWMLVAVSSVALVLGAYYYVQKKQKGNTGKINLIVEESKAADDTVKGVAPATTAITTKVGAQKKKTRKASEVSTDDESVTSTAYLRMLDFSPEGLSHRDQMEQVREAHFDRLRKTRDSRRVKPSGGVM